MNISRHDADALNAEITISVGPADYEPLVDESIKKLQKKISVPGFRPGKVPPGLIKKQYGNEIMADELNKLLSDSLYKYINENRIQILGDPLPKQKESPVTEQKKEFEFVYELGLMPDFKVELDKKLELDYKTVSVDDELIDRYVKDVRRNYGTHMHPETSEANDSLSVDLNEVENGEIKAGGIYHSTKINIASVKNEETRSKLIGLKKDDKVILKANDLFENNDEKARSLGIDKNVAETFSGELQVSVKNISRAVEAELNQELFDKMYGPGNINSEAELREKVRKELQTLFMADSEKMFRNEVKKQLVAKTNLQLPDQFLKRWLKAVNEKPLSDEDLEREYPLYAEDMRWKLIENRIIKDNGIHVHEPEVKEEAKHYIRNEFARYGQHADDESAETMSADLLKKDAEKKKIEEALLSRKVIDTVKEKTSVKEREVAYADFFK
jgi:trigger factor